MFEDSLPNGRKDLFEHRHKSSFLRISRCHELPVVSLIRGFRAKELCHWQRIEGSSLARVAAKLPNLETDVWIANDDEKFYYASRQQNRFEVTSSYPLAFFWPQESTHPAPFWPLLQYLSVWLNIATPEDDWLCVRDPEDSDDDDHDEDVDPLTLSDYLELAGIIDHVEGIVEENETTSTHSSDSEITQTFNHRLQSHLDRSKPKRYFCKIFDAERLKPMLTAMGRAPKHILLSG
ncbi:hypothetical protein MMC22_002823 [Lobaria immixta]|nr:hypothetical protein [Lobaria immixta]